MRLVVRRCVCAPIRQLSSTDMQWEHSIKTRSPVDSSDLPSTTPLLVHHTDRTYLFTVPLLAQRFQLVL